MLHRYSVDGVSVLAPTLADAERIARGSALPSADVALSRGFAPKAGPRAVRDVHGRLVGVWSGGLVPRAHGAP